MSDQLRQRIAVALGAHEPSAKTWTMRSARLTLSSGNFLHPRLYEEMRAQMRVVHGCAWNNGSISFRFWSDSSSKDESRERAENTAYFVDFLAFLLPRAGLGRRPNDLRVVCVDFDKPKRDSSSVLTSYEVNSGVTSFERRRTVVVVYRREEMEKTLIHELLHAFGFALSSDVDVNVNEARVDFMACYLNLLIYSNIHPKNSYRRLLAVERRHVTEQAFRVLRHKSFSGTTHALAYYVLKAVLFAHAAEYLRSDPRDTARFIADRLPSFCATRKPRIADGDDSLRMTSLQIEWVMNNK
jgi:hypothetical protein